MTRLIDKDRAYRQDPRKWNDEELANELRFRLRFEHAGKNEAVDSFSLLLCEAVTRILERTPKRKSKPSA